MQYNMYAKLNTNPIAERITIIIVFALQVFTKFEIIFGKTGHIKKVYSITPMEQKTPTPLIANHIANIALLSFVTHLVILKIRDIYVITASSGNRKLRELTKLPQ